jgi:hypothetical protein
VANSICPQLIQDTFKHGDKVDFRGLFMVPTYAALGAAVALALLFHPPKIGAPSEPGTGSVPH